MAPVAVEREPRYLPAAVVALHLASAASLTALVGRGLYRSYWDLSPAQAVRPRQASRSKLVVVFAALAALSFVVAAKTAADYFLLSYGVWADERGFDSYGWFPYLTGGNMARWLSDTPIYRDAREIVAEKSRRFFWGQQADLGMATWALMLAIEGRRRRIPYVWAYLSLAQLVNLSFAQNLFYLAMLLTPTPLPEGPSSRSASWLERALRRAFPSKPANWFPKPAVSVGVLYAGLAATSLLRLAGGGAASYSSSAWATLVWRATSFALLAMPALVPTSWGSTYARPHDAHGTHTKAFRAFSLAAFILHAFSASSALAYSTPGSQYHRHSIRMPFDTAKRSEWERASTAVAKVLGSTADHPVVAALGRDVLLSALSLGLWAAARAMDSRRHIIHAAWPFAAAVDGADDRSLADDVSRAAKGMTTGMADDSYIPDASPQVGQRKRVKPARNAAVAAVGASDGDGDMSATPRRRGRPREVKQEDKGQDEAPGDAAYEPSPEQVKDTVEGDVLPDEDVDWEAAALTWAMTTVGGLGCGSAGVFGGECISR